MKFQDTSKRDDLNYDIDFIDPEDLVGFISEVNEDQESPNQPEAESFPEREQEELKYTEILKESSNDYVKKRREDTRGRLAIIYTLCTFTIFLISILVAVIDGLIRHVSIVDNLTTLLPLVSGIFLGSLGFVLGYYFKKEWER